MNAYRKTCKMKCGRTVGADYRMTGSRDLTQLPFKFFAPGPACYKIAAKRFRNRVNIVFVDPLTAVIYLFRLASYGCTAKNSQLFHFIVPFHRGRHTPTHNLNNFTTIQGFIPQFKGILSKYKKINQ